MKRALKNKEKAVLENTASEDVPVDLSNAVNPWLNRKGSAKVAMIGLALSMGATSLLVTRQSDQALAAEPAGSQKAASTIPAALTQVKAPTNKPESQAVSSVSVPENPVIVEPTAISQVPGLGAKWLARSGNQKLTAPVVISTGAKNNSVYAQPQEAREPSISSANTKSETGNNQLSDALKLSSTYSVAQTGTQSNEVNAQLKAQQEFALNRLQEKSNRLRASLASLRSDESKVSSPAATALPQPNIVAQTPQQSETVTDQSKANLASRLKEKGVASFAPSPMPTPTATNAPKASVDYEVKPGDTLATIASDRGTSVSEIIKTNNLSNPNQLQINQTLTLPAVEGGSTSNQTVVVPSITSFGVTTTAPIPAPQVPVIDQNNAALAPQVPVIDQNNAALAPQVPVIDQNNAATQKAPTATNNSFPANTATTSEAPSMNSAYGMGGDTPIPQAFADMQLARTPDGKAKQVKNNPRLRSLQAEIERLRQKYRAQQAGNVVVPAVGETNNAAVPVQVNEPNPVTVPVPVFRPSTAASPVRVPTLERTAIPIPVPSPGSFRYTPQPNNDPINPEFVPNRTTKVATPPVGSVDASQSLGSLRGTSVSPQLPPLAAVDRYLPRPIDENTAPTVSAGYIWPAKGVLTSGYGWRWGRMHKGIDVANSTGTPIYATADGVIEKAGWNNGGYGNLVEIRHPDGALTRYAHNSALLVQRGQQVRQGQIIAKMGSTGHSTGPHTHFELHPNGKQAVNPMSYLQARV